MNIYLTDYRTASTTQTEMMEDIPFPQRVHWFPDTYKNSKSGLVYPPHKLADKVLDKELLSNLRQRSGKTAFILAAGNAHFAGIPNPKNVDGQLDYEYKFLALSLTQVYAGRIAQMCGTSDMVITDSSACASSLKVMMNVRELFILYGFDRVIVLTLEDAVSNPVLKFFGESKACLTKDLEDQGIKPSAFDDVNYGFNIGQGAALAIFESAKYARNSKAQLLGAYSASEESTNAIGQREDGQGFVRAAAGALQTANMSSSDIQLVKTHGTGTKSNNQAEKAALQQIFHTPFIATSYKQWIGHTMGASGLLETCLLLDDLNRGIIRAIPNRTNYDDVYLSTTRTVDGSVNILSLAAGMGNIYSAAIFRSL
jgi:3-oxoacyl-(acyl-carrier-protein) synthase